jgi:hypothetical protein
VLERLPQRALEAFVNDLDRLPDYKPIADERRASLLPDEALPIAEPPRWGTKSAARVPTVLMLNQRPSMKRQ